MWKLALATVMPLGLALGNSAETDLYGLANVSITFDQRSANAINSTPCIQAQVQANTPYLGSLSISPTDYLSVSFTLSAAGLNLSGTGRLSTSQNGVGTITVQQSSSGGCPIVGSYRFRFISLH